jgi:hypothetical protein
MPPTTIKINFVDFCPEFSPHDCRLTQQLMPHFPVEISTKPDYLFFSVFGTSHRDPRFDRCIKILCLAENIRPDFTVCDYAMSFDYLDNPRHLRVPYYSDWSFYLERDLGKSLVKSTDHDPKSILDSKTKFCNFVYSNGWAKERLEFLELLSRYKRVDSGGRIKNNLGFRVTNKLDFISSYKFTIAFENASHPGYVTEKLIEPMLVDSLPIYWGSPQVSEEFNPRSFIDCHEHPDWHSVIEKIINLDQDDSLYLERLKEPWLHDNKTNACCRPCYMIPFFQRVFADKSPRIKGPVVRTTVPGCGSWQIIL